MSLVGKFSSIYNSTCGDKLTYPTEEATRPAIKKYPKLWSYKCPMCKQYHLTSQSKLFRAISKHDKNYEATKFNPDNKHQMRTLKNKIEMLQDRWHG